MDRRGSTLLWTAIALAGAGVLLAGYLTWAHYDTSALVCGLGDCHEVQASEFATVGPLPVAVLGLGMYAAVLVCNLVAWARPRLAISALSLAFAATLGGTVFAAYLTWLELAVIGAICQWCVASAMLTVVLLALEGLLVWREIAGASGEEIETSRPGAASWNGDGQASGTTGAGRDRPERGTLST